MTQSLYEKLKQTDNLRKSFDTAISHAHQSEELSFLRKQAQDITTTTERNYLSTYMYHNPLLPTPTNFHVANNFSLLKQIEASEHNSELLKESRPELTELIGNYQIRNNTLSEAATQRAEYISSRIRKHFS